MAVSGTGVCAAGTADGQLWVGRSGEKRESGRNLDKKHRKWSGLSEDRSVCMKVAEGPVVAVGFVDDRTLITSTLLGTLTLHTLSDIQDDGSFEVRPLWHTQAEGLTKVNALVLFDTHTAIGGFDQHGSGVITVLHVGGMPSMNAGEGD